MDRRVRLAILGAEDSAAMVSEWRWAQHWNRCLFLHWPLDAGVLRPLVPESLSIETYDDQAWLSLVLFTMWVRPRGLPYVPVLSRLNEVNLRTYVSRDGQPGIYFLSVHATNRFAIRLARWLSPVPYRYAPIQFGRSEDRMRISIGRGRGNWPRIELTFSPHEDYRTGQGLEAWLVERYRLYAIDQLNRLVQGEVMHAPWQFTDADVWIVTNTFGKEFGINLDGPPALAHFSRGLSARFGRFRVCGR